MPAESKLVYWVVEPGAIRTHVSLPFPLPAGIQDLRLESAGDAGVRIARVPCRPEEG
jgi:hypothetical protein